ncbi:MAG: amidohydrolase [Candidatus Babeliaceae bacterium]|nr:amidohydrolase [Candidatus Babeliaceae bacterium]
MQVVDILIIHGTIVPMVSKAVILDAALAINSGKIVAIDTTHNIVKRYSAQTILDAHQSLILPGFVNGHTHVGMSMMRGVADEAKNLQEWLNNYIFPLEKKILSEDFVYWSTMLACYEMIQSGITMFADMYFFENASARAVLHAGMRAILGETIFIEQDIFYAEEFCKEFNNNRSIKPAFAPHSLYSCDAQTLIAAHKKSQEARVPFIIHVAEQQDELYELYKKTGMSPGEYMLSLGILSDNVIIAHGVHFSDSDLKSIAQSGASIIYNPSSNMKLGSGIAHVKSMQEHGIPVGIGTDGVASNNSLDSFAEMKTGALLQNLCVADYCKPLSPFEVVKLATIDGAHALKMGDKIGTLEVGKCADILVMGTQAFHQIPDFDIYSQIVYASKSTDVQTVIIDGKIVMHDCKMLTLDSYKNEMHKKINFYKVQILSKIRYQDL